MSVREREKRKKTYVLIMSNWIKVLVKGEENYLDKKREKRIGRPSLHGPWLTLSLCNERKCALQMEKRSVWVSERVF